MKTTRRCRKKQLFRIGSASVFHTTISLKRTDTDKFIYSSIMFCSTYPNILNVANIFKEGIFSVQYSLTFQRLNKMHFVEHSGKQFTKFLWSLHFIVKYGVMNRFLHHIANGKGATRTNEHYRMGKIKIYLGTSLDFRASIAISCLHF